MKKRVLFTTLATVALLSMSLNSVIAAPKKSSTSSSVNQTIPEQMPPGTIITYDKNNNMIVKEPDVKKLNESNGDKKISPSLSNEEKIKQDSEEQALVNKIKEESSSFPVYHLDNPTLPNPQPGMTVYYDGMGYPTKIIDSKGKPINDNVQTLSDAGVGVYTYGSGNKITITSTYVLGEGTVNWYDGVGHIGSDGTYLTNEDCATKGSLDNPPRGTAIDLRNLNNNIVGKVYKHDIGALYNAIIDIMPAKMSGYYQTPVGTSPFPYGSFNGRYYHIR